MTLEEIEKLCEEATPGPWELDEYQLFSTTVDPMRINGDGLVMNMPGINKPNEHDAKFIAASRALIPKLLEVAKAAKNLRTITGNTVMQISEIQIDKGILLDKALAALEQE